jgi:hypothetical protein
MPGENGLHPPQPQVQSALNIQFTPEGVVISSVSGFTVLSISVPANVMDELAMKWSQARAQELAIIQHVSKSKIN